MARYKDDQSVINVFKELATFELPQTAVDRDLGQIRSMLAEEETRVADQRTSRWNFLLGRSWTKYAAAAIVLLLLCLSLDLRPASKLSAAELLTKVAKNMNRLTWGKSTSKKYRPGVAEPVSVDVGWVDLKGKKVYTIYDDTYIHLADYKKMHWSVYRPEDRTLIVQKLSGLWEGPGTQVEGYIKRLKDEGLEVKRSEELRQGVDVIVLEFDEVLSNMSDDPNRFMSKMLFDNQAVKTIRTKLVISESDLLLGEGELSYFSSTDDRIITIKSTWEPVERGPVDLHELGVPHDATIINKIPTPEAEALREKINKHKQGFLQHYVAVQTEARVEDGKEQVIEAMVIYYQGKKIRVDVFQNLYGNSNDLEGPYAHLLQRSRAYLGEHYPESHRWGIRSIRIYDGLWQHILAEREDQMILKSPQRRPDGDMYADDDLDDFGWRKLWWLNEPEYMLVDDFSQANDLLAMELTAQGTERRLPKCLRLYVDPEKDYLFRRYSEENLVDASWQIDDGWWDTVKNKDRLEERVRVFDVTEYAQTSQGQWYPTVITMNGHTMPQSRHSVREQYKRISRISLLQENPKLPDELFDPEQLTVQEQAR
jgi:hypothetical protein